MEEDFYLSIIIPCYREEERIKKTFSIFDNFVKNQSYSVELVFVVDGSPDKTAEVIKDLIKDNLRYKLLDYKENKGKGYAVRHGMKHARGKYLLFADADNSTPIEQANILLKYIKDYEVVIGSRYIEGGGQKRKQSFVRIWGSRSLNLASHLLACVKVKDTQCGFKLFQREASHQIFSRQTFQRFSFDAEILAIASYLGYKIKEVGVDWYDDPHSTVHPIRDGFKFLWALILIRWNLLRHFYKHPDHHFYEV